MSLRRWDTNNPPPVRLGYALFHTRIFPELPATYHAMLVASETIDATRGFRVRIADMGPPLRFGDEPTERRLHGQDYYVGWLNELDDEDYQQVLAAAHSLRGRPPSAQGMAGSYWLGTHGVEITDPNDEDGTFATPHCSCASLVEWCFSKAGRDLVQESTLPLYSAEEINTTFCPYLPNVDEVREQLAIWGLGGAGPWPLLLPAQQMKAFQNGCPYRASKGDHPWKDE